MKVYVLRERCTLGGTLTPNPTPTSTPSPSLPHSAFLSYPYGGPSWPWTDWKGRVDWVQRGRSPGVLSWSDGVVEGLRLGLRGASVGRGGLGAGISASNRGHRLRIPARQWRTVLQQDSGARVGSNLLGRTTGRFILSIFKHSKTLGERPPADHSLSPVYITRLKMCFHRRSSLQSTCNLFDRDGFLWPRNNAQVPKRAVLHLWVQTPPVGGRTLSRRPPKANGKPG